MKKSINSDILNTAIEPKGPSLDLKSFLQNVTWDSLDEQTRQSAKRCILDAIGCALAGSRAEGFQDLASRFAARDDNALPIWGTTIEAELGWAIFFNAHAAAYYDLDDGHRRAQGHPGATIIPAALMAAVAEKCSGRAFLEAVVAGYEVAIRSALVMRDMGGPRKGSGGWALTGVAAAVGRLMGLNGKNHLNAVGLAEYYAPQAPQDRSVAHPSMMKEGIAWSASTGYNCARLASFGFTAMRPFLADSKYIADLGQNFEINKTYFKIYAACRWAHPALDGLGQMLSETGRNPDEIKDITIRTFEKGTLMAHRRPKNLLEALYSIPFALGCYLVHGRLAPEHLAAAGLADSRVLAFADRVQLVAEDKFTNQFPEKCWQQIHVRFSDNQEYTSDTLSARGDPEKPYSNAELKEKFAALAEPVIGKRYHKIINVVDTLESHSTAELARLLKL